MAMTRVSRRLFLQATTAAAFQEKQATALPQWTPGELDIHHISTGRGSCAFVICPDATTLMFDAGALYPAPDIQQFVIQAYPDDSRNPGEWIARYVLRQLQGIRKPAVDVFVPSHFHGDHIGEIAARTRLSADGTHRLTGISEVAALLPVHRVIDRGYPTYDYPTPLPEAYQRNYVAFIESHRRRGGKVERYSVGSKSQIRLLRDPASFPNFHVRNIAANGEVWTGVGETSRPTFPPLSHLYPIHYPTENMCSVALRLSYGKFDYFTAGDLTGDTAYGRFPWREIETRAAQSSGPVDVAVASHHGYADATGPGYVRALRPRVFLVLAWDSAHPTINPLHNMLSQELYPGERDVFSTAMKVENLIATRRLSELKSKNGHVVVRVAKGGHSFRIFITENLDESGLVVARFGPYACS